ncbi:hypothetical protein [Nocardia sp. NPDC056000]|uniref:hypothetical protein n=1 Tax=Nocardia sp. NPDC056000 TaxID=3345674 RepID=UPI0035D83090
MTAMHRARAGFAALAIVATLTTAAGPAVADTAPIPTGSARSAMVQGGDDKGALFNLYASAVNTVVDFVLFPALIFNYLATGSTSNCSTTGSYAGTGRDGNMGC